MTQAAEGRRVELEDAVDGLVGPVDGEARVLAPEEAVHVAARHQGSVHLRGRDAVLDRHDEELEDLVGVAVGREEHAAAVRSRLVRADIPPRRQRPAELHGSGIAVDGRGVELERLVHVLIGEVHDARAVRGDHEGLEGRRDVAARRHRAADGRLRERVSASAPAASTSAGLARGPAVRARRP
jgi:hypothetical protein